MTGTKSFLFHLQELRKTLIKCLLAISIFYTPSFLIAPKFINLLIHWCLPKELNHLNYFSPMEVFIIQLKLAFVTALAVSFPYCIWQIWKFLLPALYISERKALKWWVLSSSFLFVLGAVFCVGFILPLLMNFSVSFSSSELKPVISLSSFLWLAGWLTFAFGVMFQFPIAVMLAVRFNLVKSSFLSSKRPYIIVFILIMATILTPPDVLSQLLLAIPTYLLFEIGLFLSRKLEKKKNSEQASETNKSKTIEANKSSEQKSDNGTLNFYIKEENKKHRT